MYWSPFGQVMTSCPSRSNTLAWALPEHTRILSPVQLYDSERIGWLCGGSGRGEGVVSEVGGSGVEEGVVRRWEW